MRTRRDRYPTGGYAWCSVCGKYVPCRLPLALAHPGDGTCVLPFAHRNDDTGEPCEGRYAGALWRNPTNPSETR